MKELRIDEMYEVIGGENAYEGNSDPIPQPRVVSGEETDQTLDLMYNTAKKVGKWAWTAIKAGL